MVQRLPTIGPHSMADFVQNYLQPILDALEQEIQDLTGIDPEAISSLRDQLNALNKSITDEIGRSTSEDASIRVDFADADAIIRTDFAAADAATRALANADAEWPVTFYRTYTITADGSGDYASTPLAIVAIQNLPENERPSATRLYLLRVGDGLWSDVNVTPPAYVYILGNPGRSIFYADLPASTSPAVIAATSVLRLSARNRVRGLSVWIRNGRYAIESGAVSDNPEAIVRMEDMDVRHLGNDGARAYQAANGGDPAAVWNAERAWGFFAASGQSWLADRCSFVSRNGDAVFGQNSPNAIRGIKFVARNCRFVSEVRRSAGAIGFSLRLDSHGSRQRDTAELIDCELSGAIATTASPWLATRPQDQVADRAEWRVSGAGCTPVPYAVYDDGARALRLTSASTEPYSAITVDGSAVPLILGTPGGGAGQPEGIVRRPGAVGIQGDLYGTLDVGDHLLGGAFNLDVTRLGYRLGDCRTTSKTLVVTTDKAAATVTFAQDYRAQSNATILAAINTALAGVATADLLWVTELHRPEWRDQQARVYNGGSTTIRRKRAAALTGDDRTVRVMTPTDQAIVFGGLALEDIRPGERGRVQIGGTLNADSDLDRAVAETIVQGGTMGVVDSTGRWGVGAAYPLLQADNLIELRFLPRDQSTRAAVRPYASFTAFGDSIAAMTGASDPSLGYVPRLGRHLHLAPSNFAVGGSETADQQRFAYLATVSSTAAQLFTFSTGTNEGLANTPSQTERQDTFVGLHAASLAWLAIPESNKCRGQKRSRVLTLSSLTSDGAGGLNTRATATTSAPHGLADGMPVQIAGAAQADYNVLAAVTVTGPTTFTFPIANTPASPATGTITATTQDIAYTGSWTDEIIYFGGAMSVRSSTRDDAATWETWGDVAYLAYGVQVGDAGRFDVYVDDILAGSYRSDGPGGGMSTTYIHGTSHGSCLVRLTGLGRRRHTIRVVVTSATGAGNVELNWVSQMPVGGAAHLAGPTVLTGGTPITQDVDFGGNIYATLARVNAERLAADGLNVGFVDTAAFMRYGTDLSPDRLHPNDTGHRHIFEAFRAALDTSATARLRSRPPPGGGSVTLSPTGGLTQVADGLAVDRSVVLTTSNPDYPIAPAPLAPPARAPVTPRKTADRLGTALIVAGQDFGLPADASADAGDALNKILADVGDRGGGIVQIPVRQLATSRPIVISRSHTYLEGFGGTTAAYGGETKGTVIVPTDDYADPADLNLPAGGRGMLAHYNASASPLLVRGGFRNLYVYGVSSGGTHVNRLLFARSTWGAEYDITGKGDVTSTEACLFYAEDRATNLGGSLQLSRINLRIGQGGSASCVRFDGAAQSNVSIMNGVVLDLGHADGDGLVLANSDNVIIDFLRASGSGSGVCLRAKAYPGDSNRTCRANQVRMLSANTAAVIEGGPSPAESAKIIHMRLDSENGTPHPNIAPNATCFVEGDFDYTPSVGSASGTLGSVTVSGRFNRTGAWVNGRVRITGNPGSASGYIFASLPRPMSNSAIHGELNGFEGNTGKGIVGIVTNAVDPKGRAHALFSGGGVPTSSFDMDIWFSYEAF